MDKKKKHVKRKINYKRIAILIGVILLIFIIYKILNSATQAVSSIAEISDTIEQTNYGKVTRYIVYGTHLNIEGNIEIKEETDNIKNAQIVAKDISGNEIIINTEYEYSNNLLSFSTLDQINTGLNLEELEVTDYYILLKIQFSNETKYYSLSNDTEYGNVDYYTLTRNKRNNKIYINFGTYNNIPFMGLNITKTKKLPENVYDVVIDPGHGGSDSGAINGIYQ